MSREYENDNAGALEGAEGVKVAEVAAVPATTSAAPEPATESVTAAPQEHHDGERSEPEHSGSVHVRLEDRDCYCPKPGPRARRR
jgi:hypothetical protein